MSLTYAQNSGKQVNYIQYLQ